MSTIAIAVLFFPLIFLLWLANMADKRREETPARHGVAILVYVMLGFLWATMWTVGILAVLMGVAYGRYADIPALSARYSAQGLNPEMAVLFMQSLPRLGAGLVLLAVLGAALMLRPVRRLIARALPISADSLVDAVALAYSNLILVNLWVVIGIGIGAIAEAVEATPETPSGQMIALMWTQNFMLMLMALIGVGWLSRRGWRDVLQRLGLVWGGWRHVGVGVGLGLAMFLLLFPFSMLIEKTGWNMDPNIEKMTEQLLGPLMTSLPGVITLGAAAALGEELVYRGALQPRFGILLTSLLFALTHNQYGISLATVMVFVLGLVLGWTRRRYSTTTAIFLHATYNIAIGLSGLFFH